MNTFIQQGCIEFIKSDSKDIICIYFYFLLSSYRRILEKNTPQFPQKYELALIS